MYRSIRWRLVASYVLLTLAAVSLVSLLALEMLRRTAHQQELNDLRANAQALARQALPYLESRRPDRTALGQLARTASFLGSVRVRILDPQGEVLADSGPPGSANELVWLAPPVGSAIFPDENSPNWMVLPGDQSSLLSEIEVAMRQNFPPGTSLTVIRRTNGLWGSRLSFEPSAKSEPLANQAAQTEPTPQASPSRSQTLVKAPVGAASQPLGYVELSAGPDFSAEALAATRRALLAAGGGAVLLAALLGLLISRRLTDPLNSLKDAAGQMAAGDLAVRAPARSQDEIGELAAQFNHMAERLQASFNQLASERDALRRFIADASHELRTPITALKNFNSLLLGPAAGDSEAQAEFLQESQTQLERLEWITANLLDLSRLDAGLGDLDLADHSLDEILLAAAAPFRQAAGEKGIDLQVRLVGGQAQLHCDRARLEMALSNLLDNALKYTPPGGQVELGAEQTIEATRIWVQDSGPGIHADDLAHIFERFYRGRGREEEGSGLGLAIAKSLVQAQGGQISAVSAPGQGARFLLSWETGASTE